MDNTLSSIINEFGDFIKRFFMPSMVFFVVFTLIWLMFFDFSIIVGELNEDKLLYTLKGLKDFNNSAIFWFVLVFMIGYSYLVSMLHQHLFDDFIRKDYNYFFFNKEQDIFEKRRAKVIGYLEKEFKNEEGNYINNFLTTDENKKNDFVLYEVLCNKEVMDCKKGDYVDQAKAIGITYFSILFSVITLIIFYEIFIAYKVLIAIGLFALYIPFSFLIKSRYRARNRRAYINYLIKKELKQNEEVESTSNN